MLLGSDTPTNPERPFYHGWDRRETAIWIFSHLIYPCGARQLCRKGTRARDQPPDKLYLFPDFFRSCWPIHSRKDALPVVWSEFHCLYFCDIMGYFRHFFSSFGPSRISRSKANQGLGDPRATILHHWRGQSLNFRAAEHKPGFETRRKRWAIDRTPASQLHDSFKMGGWDR